MTDRFDEMADKIMVRSECRVPYSGEMLRSEIAAALRELAASERATETERCAKQAEYGVPRARELAAKYRGHHYETELRYEATANAFETVAAAIRAPRDDSPKTSGDQQPSAPRNPHLGSTFESWLEERGIRESVYAAVRAETMTNEQMSAQPPQRGAVVPTIGLPPIVDRLDCPKCHHREEYPARRHDGETCDTYQLYPCPKCKTQMQEVNGVRSEIQPPVRSPQSSDEPRDDMAVEWRNLDPVWTAATVGNWRVDVRCTYPDKWVWSLTDENDYATRVERNWAYHTVEEAKIAAVAFAKKLL